MKKIFILMLLLLIGYAGRAQKSRIDSLLLQLDKTEDPVKINKLIDEAFKIPNGDIAILKKGKQELAKAEASASLKKKERALLMICEGSFVLHDATALLDFSLQGARLSQSLNDAYYLTRFLRMTAFANVFAGDGRKAIYYLLEAAGVATAARDTSTLLGEYSNLETRYVALKKPDSALFYAKRELRLVNQFSSNDKAFYEESALGDMGEALTAMNKLDSALVYDRQSYIIAKNNNITIGFADLLNNIAHTYLQNKQPDSALKYAQEAYNRASTKRIWEFTAYAAAILSKIYEGRDDKKSLYYLKAEMADKDSINANEKTRQFQLIADKDRQHDQELKNAQEKYNDRVHLFIVIGAAAVLLVVGLILWRNNLRQKHTNLLLSEQKEEIATQRDNLGQALEDLKNTQTQLVQREKMASLGELTAGIAHEIQNPLNFVNNFSEVNAELIDEMQQEIDKGDLEEVKAIAADIKENQQKISQHGKRADFIVKGMLQHSRNTTGEKEPTDINVMANEFLKLSYHGLRAKDKNFNAELITNFDDTLPKVNVAHQDIGRVLLNLFNNAFYAVNEKQKTAGADYKPEVSISTSVQKGDLIIKVKDNGLGIPDAIKDKIMQPFFTTKPTGEGTGLGLSLSYDIVVKGHNGSITVNSKEGDFTEFVITLPLK